MIISTWVAISVVVFASGSNIVYSSSDTYKTKALCEEVQVRVMQIAADEPEILAIGTTCAEIKVNNEFPRNEKPKKDNLPKIGA